MANIEAAADLRPYRLQTRYELREMLARFKDFFAAAAEGNDLHCEIPISFATAALGGKVEVPTLEGPVTITIKPETQTGMIMRLAGKGVKSYNSYDKGSLYCKLVVETPVNLNDQQKDLLKKLEESLTGEASKGAKSDSSKVSSHSPKSDSFFEKFKKFVNDLSSK